MLKANFIPDIYFPSSFRFYMIINNVVAIIVVFIAANEPKTINISVTY